jgi:hypothetical protein
MKQVKSEHFENWMDARLLTESSIKTDPPYAQFSFSGDRIDLDRGNHHIYAKTSFDKNTILEGIVATGRVDVVHRGMILFEFDPIRTGTLSWIVNVPMKNLVLRCEKHTSIYILASNVNKELRVQVWRYYVNEVETSLPVVEIRLSRPSMICIAGADNKFIVATGSHFVFEHPTPLTAKVFSPIPGNVKIACLCRNTLLIDNGLRFSALNI